MRLKTLLVVMAVSVQTVFAQQELGLHFNRDIMQSGYTNPALFPREKKIHFHLPIPMPSIAINLANSGFTMAHLIQERAQDDSTFMDWDKAISKMGKKNLLLYQMNIDYLATAFKVKPDLWFTFSTTEKINVNILYTKDLANFIWNGNGAFVGETLEPALGIKILHYRELAIGAGYEYDKQWTFGLRAKYLQGLATIHTKRNDITIRTGTAEEAYALGLSSDMLINVSGLTLDFAEAVGPDKFLPVVLPDNYYNNFKNPGWAIDVGATYNYTDRITIAASILDLGAITWRSNVYNHSSKGSFAFTGVDLVEYVQKGLEGDTLGVSLTTYLDTLLDEFGFVKDSVKFRTPLNTKFYLSGTYEIDSQSYAGLVFYGEFFQGLHPAVAVSYYRHFGKIFTAGTSLAFKNRSFLNLGFSAALNVFPYQLFFLGDNLFGTLLPRHSRNVNFRIGMNWALGTFKPGGRTKRVKRTKPPAIQ